VVPPLDAVGAASYAAGSCSVQVIKVIKRAYFEISDNAMM